MNPPRGPGHPTDTIAAVATPAGRGGIGIVRVSGPDVRAIAAAVIGGLPEPRRAEYRAFRAADGQPLDRGIALYFPAPGSFTGEDVLELHGHGGPMVLDLVLQRIMGLGARLARPGEFSERAFLNDKIDLVQAEAIADLIDAGTQQAARSALRSLEGELSQRVQALAERLTELRVYVEAAIDFPEDEIDFLADAALHRRFAALGAEVDAVTAAARQGCLMRDGMTVVIAGRPNAGKSSLLNRLAQRERAIVTDIPGTTRDALHETIAVDGLPLHLVDTAGLRDSADPVERIGVDRAWTEIARADRVLLLVDTGADAKADLQTVIAGGAPADRITVVHNKIDLSGRPPALSPVEGGAELWLSAKTGAGLDLLIRHLKDCMGYQGGDAGVSSARRRHLDALARARAALDSGLRQLEVNRAGELAAEELRQAQRALGEITGEVTTEDLLGRIFASFCIGK